MTATKTVSIATCLYGRTEFLPQLVRLVAAQDYPHAYTEWIILDDSPEENTTFKALPLLDRHGPFGPPLDGIIPLSLDGIAVYYYHLRFKIPLGTKRSALNSKCRGDYIAIFDDDDYYPPCRLSHGVAQLRANPQYALAGSSRLFIYAVKTGLIYQVGPFGANHATAATLIYTRTYGLTHDFGQGHCAEETVFTKQFTEPLLQLDPRQTILVMAHGANTIDKHPFLTQARGTALRLTDFIKDLRSLSLDFYKEIK